MSGTAFEKTIDFDLSAKGIDRAIREIKEFKKQLQEGMRELCEMLLEDGVFHARVEISRLRAVDTGALMASIGHGAYDPESRTGIIYAGSYYAFFVEFGTGIVGENKPHPGLGTGEIKDFGVIGQNGTVYTKYDTNDHGEKGWWYRPVGGTKSKWTKGMPARPFMYNTGLFLEDFAKKYGAETIANYVW